MRQTRDAEPTRDAGIAETIPIIMYQFRLVLTSGSLKSHTHELTQICGAFGVAYGQWLITGGRST